MCKQLKKNLLIAALLFTAIGFYSCSNDEMDNTAEAKLAEAALNARMAPNAIGHSLTITNNSNYRYEIMAIGAQSDYNLFDNLEIFHKMALPLVVEPKQSVTFYDYRNVSNSKFAIGSWNVIDYAASTREGMDELGEFSTEKIAQLYGVLSDPNDSSSARYPVWKWIIGGLKDQQGKTLDPMGGNNATASLSYIGNADQKYNTKIKYGIAQVDAQARTVSQQPIAAPISGTPLVIVEWKRSNSIGINRTGDINITIDNYINRI